MQVTLLLLLSLVRLVFLDFPSARRFQPFRRAQSHLVLSGTRKNLSVHFSKEPNPCPLKASVVSQPFLLRRKSEAIPVLPSHRHHRSGAFQVLLLPHFRVSCHRRDSRRSSQARRRSSLERRRSFLERRLSFCRRSFRERHRSSPERRPSFRVHLRPSREHILGHRPSSLDTRGRLGSCRPDSPALRLSSPAFLGLLRTEPLQASLPLGSRASRNIPVFRAALP